MFDVHLKPEYHFAAIYLSMGIHVIAINTEPLNVLLPFNLLNIDQI